MSTCMCVLIFEKLFKLVDIVCPGLRNHHSSVVSDAILPFIILPVSLIVGTISLTLTAGVVIMLTGGSMYITSRPQTRSPFFFSWTISSIVTMYLEFQYFVMSSMEVTVLETTVIMVLVIFTCYHFYKMKMIADDLMSEQLNCNTVQDISKWRYCRICRITVKERLFHSIWWDCCMSKPNYLYFLTGQMFALVTLVYGTSLSLTTLCDNTRHINNLLLPIQCTDVYDNSMSYTLPFVTAMYGIGYSLIVMMVLLRQITIYIPKYACMQLKKSVQVINV